MKAIRFHIALALAAAALALPAIAGPLVVRAAGPSAANYKPGQRLPDGAPLVLKAGDSVTVLDAKGTRSLSGPGSFRFDGAAETTAAPTVFAELLTQKTERRARIGAVRGLTPDPSVKAAPPGVWAVDTSASGTVCALDPSQVSLWRAAPAAEGSLTLTRVADGKSAAVTFPAGQPTANWPAALTPADGQYKLTGGGAPVTIDVRRVAPAPASIDALAAALVDKGCTSQFQRLAKATTVSG